MRQRLSRAQNLKTALSRPRNSAGHPRRWDLKGENRMITTALIYLPGVLGVIGIVIATRAFAKVRHIAFLLMATVFCVPVVAALSKWLYLQRFVQTELDANTWTAPGVEVELTDPVIYGILVVAVWFFARDHMPTKKEISNQRLESTGHNAAGSPSSPAP